MTGKTPPHSDAGRGRAVAAIAVCAVLWSIGGLFIKIVSWNPFAIAGVRSLIGGLVILAYLRKPRFSWSPWQITAAVCYAGCMITFVAANKLTTAANSILLQYTAPVYAAIFGGILLGEKTSLLDWTTIAVVIGAMVLFFLDRLSFGGTAGNLIAIASGVFFAATMVCLRGQKGDSPLESILLSHFITFAVSIPFLWTGAPGWAGWGGLAVLGVFQIGFPSILLAYGVKRVTALHVLLVSMLEPLFNPVWVFLVLGETPAPIAVAGGIVILAAVTARSALTLRSAAPATRSG